MFEKSESQNVRRSGKSLLLVVIFFILTISNIYAKKTPKTNLKKTKFVEISGQLVDFDTRKPLKKIKMEIGDYNCKTDGDGKFTIKIPFIKKTVIKAKVNTKRYFPVKKIIFLSKKKDRYYIILSAYRKETNKKHKRICGISGTITYTNGYPAKGIGVKLYNKDKKYLTSTDREGFYRIFTEKPGKYTLKISIGKEIKDILLKKGKIIFKNITINAKVKHKSMQASDVIGEEYTNKKTPMYNELERIRKRREVADIESKEIVELFMAEGDFSGKGGKTGGKKGGKTLKSPSYDESFSVAKPAPRSNHRKSGLRASFVDDNKQFNYFLDFLSKYSKRVRHYDIDISERFIIKVTDKNNKPLPDVKIEIYSADDTLLENGLTYSDGTYLFFASMYKDKNFILKAKYNKSTIKKHFSIQDKRKIRIVFKNIVKKEPDKIPLDILFIFDTTGSMGEEIDRLKSTIDIIKMNITEFKPKPDTRFGMVLYKDIKDIYVTKVIPFTSDFDKFSQDLHKSVFSSGGGGDGPEDLQKALKDAMTQVKWRQKGVKLAFIITDAPPHLYKWEKDFTYVKAAMEAKRKGIKLFSIGTGGLNINGEYILRQLSQFTYANYIFLTYGEKGESEGGKIGSVSHHTGENFTTDKLEAILIQIIKKELKFYSGKEVSVEEEYFQANAVDTETAKQTLEQIFLKGINQLYDYSTIKIGKDTPTAISPIITFQSELKATAEYFYENLQLALVKSKKFKAVERKDLQPVLNELKFQLDELADESKAAELGKFMGAKLLITGKLYEKGDYYELYLKLENVETVEILSVTKLRISKKLGL